MNQCQSIPEVQKDDFQSSIPVVHEPPYSNLQKVAATNFTVSSAREAARVSFGFNLNKLVIQKTLYNGKMHTPY